MQKWRILIKTAYGTLLVTDKGSSKVILKCSQCGRKIESPRTCRGSMASFRHRIWVLKGNKLAVCNKCNPKSKFKAIE